MMRPVCALKCRLFIDRPAQKETLIKALHSGMVLGTITVKDASGFCLEQKKKDGPELAHGQRVRYLRHLGLIDIDSPKSWMAKQLAGL